jgi:hypothetical protein
MNLVFGRGVYEKGKYKGSINGRHTKEKHLWAGILQRCYSKEYHQLKPTYETCTASDNFRNFQYFAGWCNHQVGFGLDDWQLDKDLLFSGNKLYSEDTCIFIPSHINMLLVKQSYPKINATPQGVFFRKDSGKYRAICQSSKEKTNLGDYLTPEEAFSVYKEFKEGAIKSLAELYKDRLDDRAYTALVNYEVTK